jgi:putative MATE family efflux protein
MSRAIGAGDDARAQAVALHALVIGALGGVVYSVLLLWVSVPLFTLLGGRGDVLREALGYSAVLFGGAIAVWLFNTLASILRGTGNMRVPSAALIGAALLQIALGGTLGLGLAGAPRLGMPGVALGQIVAQTLGAAFLFWALRRGTARLRLRWRGVALQRRLFGDILRVGAVACLSPLQSVTTMVLMAGFVAQLGVLPLAGYAIGQRLEFLMSTVAFGIGLASVPMVGMAVGAGQVARARRVAWTAASVTAAVLGVVGLVVALAPDLWAAIFTREAQVLGYARQFLHWAGPAFAFFGFGLTLYFAAQGAGRMTGPVAAATMRLVVVAAGGSVLVAQGAEPWQLFALSAAAMVTYGLSCALALKIDRWQAAR